MAATPFDAPWAGTKLSLHTCVVLEHMRYPGVQVRWYGALIQPGFIVSIVDGGAPLYKRCDANTITCIAAENANTERAKAEMIEREMLALQHSAR